MSDCRTGSGSPVTETGSCLLFDTAKFRQRIYGVALGFELIDLLLIFVLYWLIRHRKFQKDEEKVAIGTDDVTNDENHLQGDGNGNDSRAIKNGLSQSLQPNYINYEEMDNVRETVIDF
jgi:hypothetical protein